MYIMSEYFNFFKKNILVSLLSDYWHAYEASWYVHDGSNSRSCLWAAIRENRAYLQEVWIIPS